MVFASYNSASYLLPLDNDQSVTFYRNENRLFPAAIGPSSVAGGGGGSAPPPGRNNHSNTTTTDMLTAAYHHEMQQQHLPTAGGGAGGGASGGGNMIAGDCPFGRVQSPVTQQQQQQFATQHHPRFGGAVAMCEDFQPVGYLNGSSNGYYGFVPSLASQDANGSGSGGGDGGGDRCVTAEISDNNNHHHQHLPAITPNVNGHHVSSIHFHGNHHRISCAVDEQNNNNNADDGGNTPEDFYHLQPFPLLSGGGQFPRKRKEANLLPDRLHDDEEMEVSSGQQHPKRRKTEPETMLYPLLSNNSEEPLPPGRYLHQVEIHHSAVDEMECQEQQLTDETDQQQQQQPAGHDGQTAASKSKYFDTNRCMMSHMI
uniref:Uncharacterized protein n=1 Tax=Anopheles farauti TaxID=69004 RepID=A0A182QMI3_9DIPT